MASVWIRTRETRDGGKRFRVEYRPGGREEPARFAGSFKTKRLATLRAAFVEAEVAAGRIPELKLTDSAKMAPTFTEAARRWQAARVDVSDATRTQHRIHLDKLIPLIGTSRIDTLTMDDFIDVVAELHAKSTARETIRKTLGTGAMVLDLAGVSPNPARNKQIKLPYEAEEEISPPSAEHVEAVYRLLATKHKLPLLFLDWSGQRVSSIDKTQVGDYDEPRRRVRRRAQTTKTRKALWIDLPTELADAIEATLPPREDRDLQARLFARSGSDALRTAITRACQAAGIPTWSPHDLRHRRISLLHLRGVPWARIGEFVGQSDLAVTANTYTHVLSDETELDYRKLLRK